LKELELTEGKATRIPAVLKSLEDTGSPLPKLNTDEDRSFFEIALFIHETMLEVQLKS
jgi:ATP-dependent DNA helicase RecG